MKNAFHTSLGVRHASVLSLLLASCATVVAAPPDKPTAGAQAPASQSVSHAQALRAARENRMDDALRILEGLRDSHPENNLYLFDYVTVNSWAGRHAEAVRAGTPLLGQAGTPPYALEAVAVSARELQQYRLALEIYDQMLALNPAHEDARLGRARTLLESGDSKSAREELERLRTTASGRNDVLELIARTYEAEGAWTGLLAQAQALLEIDPASVPARKMRFSALRNLGAHDLALALTPEGMLSAEERAGAEHDRMAFEIQLAGISADQERGAARWRATDAVINKATERAAMLEAAGQSDNARRQNYDLIISLAGRRQARQAIALYEKLASENADFPPYVKLAVASAYLAAEQPGIARDLFASALPQDPHNLNAQFGYFYALLESGHHEEAMKFIDGVAASTPEWLDPDIPQLRRENPGYPLAQSRAGLARAYTNRLQAAQDRLDDLTVRAPANNDIRNSRNITHQLRGWPRRAETDYRWMLAAEPDYPWAQIGLFDSAMAIQDHRLAEQSLQRADALIPDESATQKRRKEWETHNLREFRLETGFGKSSGGSAVAEPTAARDRRTDAYLYSSPIDHDWRLFGRLHDSSASFSTVSPSRSAYGAGLEYRSRDWRVSGEALGLSGGRNAALALNVTHAFSDYLSVKATAEKNSLETPLRAHADQVDADRGALEATYRWHESRSVGAGISRMNFSDGNRRNAWFGAWSERIVSGPVYRLDTRLDYYGSTNSLPAATVSYFNPDSDHSLIATLDNQWLQFRRYERSLNHRLLVSAGTYWQQGFGYGDIYALRYEQTYEHNQRLSLRAGIGRTWRPFDGVRERLDAIFVNVNWRF